MMDDQPMAIAAAVRDDDVELGHGAFDRGVPHLALLGRTDQRRRHSAGQGDPAPELRHFLKHPVGPAHARDLAIVCGPSGWLTRSSSIRSEQAIAMTAGLGSRSLRTADSSRDKAMGPNR